MPLLRSSTRPTPVQCFFCLSTTFIPPKATTEPASTRYDRKGKGRIAEAGTQWNWYCERCGCQNLRDERGEMISDLPAMHETAANERSFSLRATPSSSHLPSSSSSASPFCRGCLSNQTLIMNMLANYLPDDDDPSFPTLYADLPAYLARLHVRYPPVCSNCQPGVDAILRRSDHRAQIEAWGSALKRGAQSSTVARDMDEGGVVSRSIWIWRMKGVLWAFGTMLSWIQGITAIIGINLFQPSFSPYVTDWIPLSLVAFHTLSFGWIGWNPYWYGSVRSHRPKVRGMETWKRNMFYIAATRTAASATIWNAGSPPKIVRAGLLLAFLMELALLIHAIMAIRINEPVAIKLVRPVSVAPTSSALPAITGQQHLTSSISGMSGLSLSQQQSSGNQRTNPIFGHVSLQSQTHQVHVSDGEPMDWEPSPAAVVYGPGNTIRPSQDWTSHSEIGNVEYNTRNKEDWDAFATNKQRMFPQNYAGDETGLETLLAGWGIGGAAKADGLPSGNQPASIEGNRAPTRKEELRFHRFLGSVFVGLRLCGTAASLIVVPDHRHFAYLNGLDGFLYFIEAGATCVKLADLMRDRTTMAQSLKWYLALGVSAIDTIVRGMFLAAPMYRLVAWTQVLTDPRAVTLRWLCWTVLDLVGAQTVP
ncbi:hypothetical protein IAU60_005641 [Kwoniella sp. DSM 27419]